MPSKTDDFKSICMHNCPFGSSVSSNSPGLTCSSEASFSASGSLASGVPALDSMTSSQIFMRRFLFDIAIFLVTLTPFSCKRKMRTSLVNFFSSSADSDVYSRGKRKFATGAELCIFCSISFALSSILTLFLMRPPAFSYCSKKLMMTSAFALDSDCLLNADDGGKDSAKDRVPSASTTKSFLTCLRNALNNSACAVATLTSVRVKSTAKSKLRPLRVPDANCSGMASTMQSFTPVAAISDNNSCAKHGVRGRPTSTTRRPRVVRWEAKKPRLAMPFWTSSMFAKSELAVRTSTKSVPKTAVRRNLEAGLPKNVLAR
mmetsp:Transcript_117690/g.375065  ORF Transcript_117690/g.375065 Transcript_117690/m.375065 type:complete len:317 (+) Transcript_117690:1160-2110(+)